MPGGVEGWGGGDWRRGLRGGGDREGFEGRERGGLMSGRESGWHGAEGCGGERHPAWPAIYQRINSGSPDRDRRGAIGRRGCLVCRCDCAAGARHAHTTSAPSQWIIGQRNDQFESAASEATVRGRGGCVCEYERVWGRRRSESCVFCVFFQLRGAPPLLLSLLSLQIFFSLQR